ncbi:MAG: SDR family oxidoreductase [Xanthobacteraceae bacterium]
MDCIKSVANRHWCCRSCLRQIDGTVEELGALSVFLACDAAASITGIALPVDGGWTAH